MEPIERFIKYARIDTQADNSTHTTPSTEKQKNLGRVLVEELIELGLQDAFMDEWGNVYAHLLGRGAKVGFNAHMDTALETTGTNVNPNIISNYDGKDIILNEQYSLSPKMFPRLKKYIGKTIITTDGNTLLGADDKAGIAIIMSALEKIVKENKEHNNISICFTVDEEIGEGPDHFDLKKMDADYAYSFDGSDPRGIGVENFNACRAHLNIKGFVVHPGEGKDTLINALLMASQIINKLPQNETPYNSEGYQSYWHITSLKGTSEEADVTIILRDFNGRDINRYLEILKTQINAYKQTYPKAKFSLEYEEEYRNMKIYADKKPEIIKKAQEAIRKNGLEPINEITRGGTDGATFSKMGLVTPNLGTGSYNHHGRYEFLVKEEFEKLIDICADLMRE